MLQLDHITKLSRNRGGIRRVDLLFEADIVAMPSYNPVSLYWTGPITLAPDTQHYSIYFTKGSLRMEETTDTGSPHGDIVKKRLSGRIPHDRPLLQQLRLRLLNNRVSIVFQDGNGHWRIMRRMRCRPRPFTGTRNGYNGMELDFFGQDELGSGFWEFEPGVISAGQIGCESYTPAQFLIGDPDTDEVIGDPGADEVIGWLN